MAVGVRVSLDRCYRLRRLLPFLCFYSIFAVSLSSQVPEATPPVDDDPGKTTVLRTDLVTLTLTVTDLYGRYVSGLTKNAFTIQDNNQEQDITYFSDSDAPVSVGVLFDVSGSMSGEKIAKAILEWDSK